MIDNTNNQINQNNQVNPIENKKPKKKVKLRQWLPLAIILLIVGVGLFFAVINDRKVNFKEGECGDNLYLGHCFNISNKYFGCHIEANECSEESLKLVLKIKLFEDMSVVIYGTPGCPWCAKQLYEFGAYADYLIEKGMYVDCPIGTQRYDCLDVKITPTWKEKGQIAYEGYLSLDKIQIVGGE